MTTHWTTTELCCRWFRSHTVSGWVLTPNKRKNLTYDLARECATARRPTSGLRPQPNKFRARPSYILICAPTAQRPRHPPRDALVCQDAPVEKKIIFFIWEAILKNILSTSYYFLFENRLHQYILRDETNKTRSHLHMFSWCFTLVTTYVMTYSLCSSNLCVYHFAVVTTYVYKEYCFCINSCMWVYDRFY